jgi:nitrate/nitrite transporter NarK
MINVTVREDMIATAFGLTTLIMAVGGVLGPIGLGYMADELKSYRYPFYVLTGTRPCLPCSRDMSHSRLGSSQGWR